MLCLPSLARHHRFVPNVWIEWQSRWMDGEDPKLSWIKRLRHNNVTLLASRPWSTINVFFFRLFWLPPRVFRLLLLLAVLLWHRFSPFRTHKVSLSLQKLLHESSSSCERWYHNEIELVFAGWVCRRMKSSTQLSFDNLICWTRV